MYNEEMQMQTIPIVSFYRCKTIVESYFKEKKKRKNTTQFLFLFSLRFYKWPRRTNNVRQLTRWKWIPTMLLSAERKSLHDVDKSLRLTWYFYAPWLMTLSILIFFRSTIRTLFVALFRPGRVYAGVSGILFGDTVRRAGQSVCLSWNDKTPLSIRQQ